MMNEFKRKIVEELEAQGFEVAEVITNKNNVTLTGLSVASKNSDAAIRPTFYVEEMFEKTGGDSKEAVYRIIKKVRENVAPSLDIESFSEKCPEKDIRVRLVKIEGNKNLLEDKDYVAVFAGDIAAIPYALIGEIGDGIGSITITRKIAAGWNKTVSELVELGLSNEEPDVSDINEILCSMTGMDLDELYGSIPQEQLLPMFVVSNKQKIHGASCILRPDVRRNVLDALKLRWTTDIGIILPSSIHETIVIPVRSGFGADDINQMVHEVNDTQVAPEDRLSDNAYLLYEDGRIEKLSEKAILEAMKRLQTEVEKQEKDIQDIVLK